MSEYSAPVGAPIWFDLISEDTARAAAFYSELFGWEVDAPPNVEFGGYQNFVKNGRRVAGLSPVMEGGGPPNVWSVYLYTTDATATAEDVAKSGGSIIVPPMAIGDDGTMVFAIDSAGAAIGFWQPGTHPGFTEWGRRAPRTGSNATASRTRRRWTSIAPSPARRSRRWAPAAIPTPSDRTPTRS